MLLYLIKSGLCLAALFIFYKVFLEQMSSHLFKRFFLMASLVISFIIPLISFTTYVPVDLTFSTTPEAVETLVPTLESSSILPLIFISIYGLGVLIFGFNFVKNLISISRRIRTNQRMPSTGAIHVLLLEKIVPHTFFNYIFLNKIKYEAKSIPKEVIVHETVHAREKHSVDVVFIELLCVLYWFNPLIYLFRNAIKLNHEFLADRSVLRSGINPVQYQKTLLAFSSSASSPQFANAINYSNIKKRFTVMRTNTSKRTMAVRALLIIPVLSLLLYSFSSRNIVHVDSPLPIATQQDGATDKEIKEYNALAKKYNAMDKEDRVVKLSDLQRLEYIYKKMTANQRRNAEPFPECIPPPPPPPAPDAPDVEHVPGSVKPDSPPPPPPPPPAPDEHIKQLAEKNALFYYQGKEITYPEVIVLLRERKNVQISTDTKDKDHPKVYIAIKD